MGWNVENYGIYVALRVRDGQPVSFHWSLYIVYDTERGESFEAVDKVENGPWYILSEVTSILKYASRVTAMIKVGQTSAEALPRLRRILEDRSSVHQRNAAKFSCRIWVLNALEFLDRESFISCKHVEKIEKEVRDMAEYNVKARSQGGDIIVFESAHSA